MLLRGNAYQPTEIAWYAFPPKTVGTRNLWFVYSHVVFLLQGLIMKKSKILMVLFFFTMTNSMSLYAFDLITKEEYMEFLGERSDKSKKVKVRSLFGNEKNLPKILIERPTLGSKIGSPTNIRLSFKANTDSKIDIDSLSFLYGWLGLDITDRIKENATITISGLSAENISLPSGDHVITVKISDDKGRMKEKEIEFTIK